MPYPASIRPSWRGVSATSIGREIWLGSVLGGVSEEGRPTRQILKFDPSAAPGSRVSGLSDLLQTSSSSLAVAYEETAEEFRDFGIR